jgi:hypothetical protein
VLLFAWSESNRGKQAALEQLMPLVYAEVSRENRTHFFGIAAA